MCTWSLCQTTRTEYAKGSAFKATRTYNRKTSSIQAPENQRIMEPSEESSSSSASSSSTSREGPPLTSQSHVFTVTGNQKTSPLAFNSTNNEDEIRLPTDQPTAKPTTNSDQLQPTLNTMYEVKEERGS